jgi:hypothetical protein
MFFAALFFVQSASADFAADIAAMTVDLAPLYSLALLVAGVLVVAFSVRKGLSMLRM